MSETPGDKEPTPGRWHFVLAFAPVVLALLALAGLASFHCARI